MKQYRSLKALPGAPAGTVWEYDEESRAYGAKVEDGKIKGIWFGIKIFEGILKNYPEWFEEVKVETLEEAVEKILSDARHGINLTQFSGSIENLRIVYERTKGGAK